jgi:hypothetical protein
MWIRTTPTRCRRASEGRTPSLHEDPDGRRDALGERERKVAAGHRAVTRRSAWSRGWLFETVVAEPERILAPCRGTDA